MVTPAVAAVVVARSPGPWFEDCLAGLATQDYPSLRVLVVDVASSHPVRDRVASMLPDAVVVERHVNDGFGAAANVVLDQVRGAPFLLFLHDDVALQPGAVTTLVTEALRSNAGVCGAKLVDWNDTRLLRHVGASVDKTGVQAPYAEPGELDQEQHDRVRDVFCVSSGVMLVRADLFKAIGGFDPAIDFLGDDLDLCWRAQVAGARVLIVPDAVARHVGALGERRSSDDGRRLLIRHRLRTIGVCYGWLHLVRVMPQAVIISLAELIYALVLGRFRQAGDVIHGWVWNLRRMPSLMGARRRTQRTRRVKDSDIRRLQVRGSARLTAFLRGQIGGDARWSYLAQRGRNWAGEMTGGPQRVVMLVWFLLALLLAVGSRHLITRGIPAIGDFAPFAQPGSLLADFWGGWREIGLGTAGVGPLPSLLLGLGGYAFLGGMGLLRQVLVLGLLPLGAIGCWRLTGPLASRRARLAGSVAYVAAMLPFNAVATGDWRGLLVVSALPWCLLRVARLSRVAPYGAVGGEPGPGVPPRTLAHQVVSLGLLMTVTAAFAPAILLIVPAMAVAVLAGAIVSGSLLPQLRGLFGALAATVLALGLLFPWWLQVRSLDGAWATLVGPQPLHRPEQLGDLIRFQIGPFGSWLLVAGLLVAAVPLLVGRGWRLAWAARAWALVLGGFGSAWAAGRGWFGVDVPDTIVLLAPAALGLAFAAALAVVAYERDVAGRAFGWQQLTGIVAAVAGFVWVLPLVAGSLEGDWDTPDSDWREALGFLDLVDTDEGSFRVAWVGADEILPVAAWPVDDRLSAGTSQDSSGDVRAEFVLADDQGGERVADAVAAGLSGRTSRLGRLLAPLSVRYLVVLQRSAPSFAGGVEQPVGGAVEQALATQLDLRRLSSDPGAFVFENTAWLPRRAMVEGEVPEAGDVATVVGTPTPAGVPVLTERIGVSEQRGRIGQPGEVYAADREADRWSLEVDGIPMDSRPAYGSARLYVVDRAGEAELVFQRPIGLLLTALAQIALLVVVLRIAAAEAGRRRIRRRRRPDPVAAPEPVDRHDDALAEVAT
jgi:GT2 family glycosyltransferase